MTEKPRVEAGAEFKDRLGHLMPCPFCGGSAQIFTSDGTRYWAGCDQCEAEGPWAENKTTAESAWNRRIA